MGPVYFLKTNVCLILQVWLAALRETDKDHLEEHIICEDHFLPEDLSKTGVSSDAIPIMPPYLDVPLGLMGSWSGDPLQEEEQWTPGPDPPKQVWMLLFS